MTLLNLIDKIEGNLDPTKYRARAEAWAKENPKAFALFERFALQAAERKCRFGMKALAERVRWEVMMRLKKDADGFRINNNYVSHIGRMIAEKHPHIKQFVEFRRVKGEEDGAIIN